MYAKLKKISCCLMALFLLLSCLCLSVSAKSNNEIHVINLTNKNGKTSVGDAVLLKSNEKYLLMDVGPGSTAANLKAYLKSIGAYSLSIYISHYDSDHTAGLSTLLNSSTIHVKRIYLPDKRYGADSPWNVATREKIKKMAKKRGIPCISLKVGSKFNVGEMSCKVIGPIGSYTYTPETDRAYRNNYSLSTMVTCGKFKFLTMGDSYAQAEYNLFSKYGTQLKANIMKMSHHAGNSSCTDSLMKYIAPNFVFAQTNLPGADAVKRTSLYATPHITCNDGGIVYKIGKSSIKVKLLP